MKAKSEGKVSLLGTSCSFPAVILTALEAGWLDHIDVVQLSAKHIVSDPSLVSLPCADLIQSIANTQFLTNAIFLLIALLSIGSPL